jgi:limonene-1,2-epoxide hydrolase
MASEAEKIVSDFCAAWPSLNLDKIMSFIADDAVYHNIPMEPVRGKDAIRAVVKSFMPPSGSIEFKILHAMSAGNVVMNERVDTFDLGAKKISLPVAGVFEIKNGKIAAWRDYFDLAMYTKQMA